MRILACLLGLSLAAFATHSGAAVAQTVQPGCGGKAGLPAGVSPGVYRGTLGGLPVVLQVGQPGTGGSGVTQYAYERRGLGIGLEATQAGGKLLLREDTYDQKASQSRPLACFTLTPSGSTLKGTWTKLGQLGQKVGLPVSLNRLDAARVALSLPSSPGLLKLRRDDPFAFLLVNHPWVGLAGGAGVREPLSGLSYWRVPGAAALNAALQDLHLEHVVGALTCRADAAAFGREGAYDLSQSGRYATPKLLSYLDEVGYDCGGVHPDAYAEGIILDRLTGERLTLTDLWAYLDEAEQHRLYLAALPAKLDAECKDFLATRDHPTYTGSLTGAGLKLVPTDLPHAAAACGEAVTLPYAKLKGQTSPELPYYSEFYR